MSHNSHLDRLCQNFNQRLEYFVDFEFTYFAGFCPFWCGSKMKHFHPNGPSVKCAKAFTNLTLRSLFFLIRILLFSYHKSITFTDPLWYIRTMWKWQQQFLFSHETTFNVAAVSLSCENCAWSGHFFGAVDIINLCKFCGEKTSAQKHTSSS